MERARVDGVKIEVDGDDVGNEAVGLSRKRAPDSRVSPRKRGYTTAWDKISRAFLRENVWCVRCGAPSECTDHIIPVRYGGTDRRENLQALCNRCNRRKTKEDADRYR